MRNGKRLRRNRREGRLLGVCAGLADYLEVDPIWVRISALILVLVSGGTAVLLYFLIAILVPPAMSAPALDFATEQAFATLEQRFADIDARLRRLEARHADPSVRLAEEIERLRAGDVRGRSLDR